VSTVAVPDAARATKGLRNSSEAEPPIIIAGLATTKLASAAAGIPVLGHEVSAVPQNSFSLIPVEAAPCKADECWCVSSDPDTCKECRHGLNYEKACSCSLDRCWKRARCPGDGFRCADNTEVNASQHVELSTEPAAGGGQSLSDVSALQARDGGSSLLAAKALRVTDDGRIFSYWDDGDCGFAGPDVNWEICGKQKDRICPQFVHAEHCPGMTAVLARTHGAGNWKAPVEINGCRYAFFAEYRCAGS